MKRGTRRNGGGGEPMNSSLEIERSIKTVKPSERRYNDPWSDEYKERSDFVYKSKTESRVVIIDNRRVNERTNCLT
jgi:hypothetical protein